MKRFDNTYSAIASVFIAIFFLFACGKRTNGYGSTDRLPVADTVFVPECSFFPDADTACLRRECMAKQGANDNNHDQKCCGNSWQKHLNIFFVITLSLSFIAISVLWHIVRHRIKRRKAHREMEEKRSQLFATITHKLHSPLSVIESAATDALSRIPVEADDLRHDVADILRHEHGLTSLINQLLDIAKASLKYKNIATDVANKLNDVPKDDVQADETAAVEAVEPDYVKEANQVFLAKLTDAIVQSMAKGKLDYDALAYEMTMSRAQLNRKVKAITGHTTTQYILQVRLNHAKHLLDTTSLSVWEVALKCGMDDDAYFSSLFKKVVGQTPLQYKHRNRFSK